MLLSYFVEKEKGLVMQAAEKFIILLYKEFDLIAIKRVLKKYTSNEK
jgi:hypothetical protein